MLTLMVFKLLQYLSSPNFTENSSSLFDLMFVSNKNHMVVSGVGDPFLSQLFLESLNSPSPNYNASRDIFCSMIMAIMTA